MTQNPTTEPTVDLPFPTTDARKWAAEFVRLHGGDEGLMLSWFANAIEHGRGPSEARATAPAGLREAAQRVVAIQTDGGYRSELNKAVDDLRAALAADSEPVE